MDLESLLDALELGDIAKLVEPVAALDADLARDYASVAADKAGITDEDARATVATSISSLFAGLASQFDGSGSAVSNALTSIKPLDYAQLTGYAAAEINATLLQDGVIASQVALADYADYAAAGDEWGLPDENFEGDPGGDGSDGHPKAGQQRDHLTAGLSPFALNLPNGLKVGQQLRDYAEKLEELWADLPDALDLGMQDRAKLGNIVHFMIMAQYLADHPQCGTMVDNRIADAEIVCSPIDFSSFRDALKRLVKLTGIGAAGNNVLPVFLKIQAALSQGLTDARTWLRPDILDPATKEVYEIKPVGKILPGLGQLFAYLTLLNLEFFGPAAMDQIGQFLDWAPGVGFNGGVPFEPGTFWRPGTGWTPPEPVQPLPPSADGKLRFFITGLACPGIILYQIFEVENNKENVNRIKAATVLFTTALLVRRLLIKVAKQTGDDAAAAIARAQDLSPEDARRLSVFCEIIALAVEMDVLAASVPALIAL